METTILGIDPGSSGGLAWIYADGEMFAVGMPDTDGDIVEQLRMIKASRTHRLVCYIEDIPKFVSGSDAAMFSFSVMFMNYGFLLGALHALEIPTFKVIAGTWQRSLGLGRKDTIRAPKGATPEEKQRVKLHNAQAKRDFKKKLKGEAQRRYPHLKITLEKSDAILIADYGLRQQGMTTPPPAQAALI